MPQLLLAAVLLLAVFFFVRWLRNANPSLLAGAIRRMGWIGAGIGALAIVGLLVTRNPGFLIGLLFFLAPLLMQLLRQWTMSRRMGGGWRNAGSGERNSSEVHAEYLSMSLDHDSGEMQGRVLKGRFAGRQLADLGEVELLELLRECAGDGDSVRLLESYLDHRLDVAWRQRRDGAKAEQAGAQPGATRNTDMTIAEAWEVLGLAPGATPEEIRTAHRRLMQTVHPDRGGSDYLAARVNRAKDLLLPR